MALTCAVVDVVRDHLGVDSVENGAGVALLQVPGEAVEAHVVVQVLTHARQVGHHLHLGRAGSQEVRQGHGTGRR